MDKIIEDMPLVDLHLHIDGAIGIDKAYEIITRDEIDLGVEINSKVDLTDALSVKPDCKDLTEFLEKFDIPCRLMQSREHIIEIIEDLIERLANEKIIYAELRFAPQLHINEGLNMEEVVKAAIEGINNGMKKCDSIKVKLILCMMRGGSFDLNRETINLASKYIDSGVCAIDLAGAEALYPTSDYKEFFDMAKEKKVPYTIHAGEASGPDSIKCAVEFGTSRIGHGISLIKDEELYNIVKDKSVLLEVCPISNLKTNSIDNIDNHPIRKFFDDNLNVCIGSDDMTVQGSRLKDEYYLLKEKFNFTYEEMIKLNINAVKSSFMNEDDKLKYIHILDNYLK